MQHDQASAVLDSEIPTDVIRRQCEANAADSSQNLDEMTAFQDVQIRRLEDLGSWADSFLENPEQVRLLQEVHRSNPRFAHRLAQAAVAMPEVGTDFVGFRLVKEIGKGAFARVFLAVQGELADRLVVLKVSPSYDDESGTLAQLQHTNVVPLYSVHRAEPLQAVCMPFFGLTTLAHILKDIKGQNSLPESGKSLVSTLIARNSTARVAHESKQADNVQEPVRETEKEEPAKSAVSTAILDKLQSLSYVDAVLWMGARLADGLAHAHERGILHRDLKPANILITDEGQPMLLDFNLAHDTKVRSKASVALLGGTLPYMAPEQLSAYRDETVAENCNSDVYSLGIILYELLAGRHPFESRYGPFEEVIDRMAEDRQQPPARLGKSNRAVSPAVESIIRRCLEPNPTRRYQSSRELQEDLQCQLAHQPLKHAPNASTFERLQKWTRRHPRLASTTSVGILSVLVIVGMLSLLAARNHRLARLESEATYREFLGDLKTAEFLLTPFTSEPEKLQQGFTAGQQAIARYQVLDNASWREMPAVRLLPAEKQETLGENLGELFFLLARAHLMQAVTKSDPGQRGTEARDALRWHSAAENCLGGDAACSALAFQRAEIEDLIHSPKQTGKRSEIHTLVAPRTALDQYLLATEYHGLGQFHKALDLLEKATRKNPTNFWSWFMRGVCHDSLAQYESAVSCYSTSIALQPEFPWTYYNRGLAHLRLKKCEEARADFTQTLERQPDHSDAILHRALAYQGLGQFKEAVQDLTEALKLGAPATQIYSLRAPLRQKLGDSAGAQSDLAECVKSQPTSDRGWLARGYARMTTDPIGALADNDEALKLNPRSLAGLQNKANLLGRLGRTQEAIRVLDQAVDLYPDFIPARSGRGVYHARLSERELAIEDAEFSIHQDKSAANVYQLAGIYALTSRTMPKDRQEALRLLSLALTKDVGLVDVIPNDKDLDSIRQDASFIQLVDKARSLRASLEEHSRKAP
ncbi:MAG TPA: protein kinase [Gemmataceae bacterium]|jgi:serine/threonine protein kinase/Flp pilus assembly protein TadD|nr:protein kinase [Gemmataceae bacterium]